MKINPEEIFTSDESPLTRFYNTFQSEYPKQDYDRKLKKVMCGKKLHFDKKGSYQSGGKIIGYCFNNKFHRLRFKIFSKLMYEPDFDELQEVIVSQSDL